MKNINIKIVTLLLLSVCVLTACYNKHTVPQEKDPGTLPVSTHTIEQIKKLYVDGRGGTILSHGTIIKGIVSTSDERGNFYKTINIQDSTGGIELKMGMIGMHLLYPQGTEVAVFCEGLVLGKYGDMINMGFESNNEKYETSYVPEIKIPEIMHRGHYIGIEPISLDIKDFDKKYANMLIKIPKVQFIESELGQTFANPQNKNNVPSVNRTLIDPEGNTVIVRTSSYSAFAGKKVPEGSGPIIALLYYFRDTPQLILNSEKDACLTNSRF